MEQNNLVNTDSFNLSKDVSLKIKGIAIIIMLIHHFYGFPNWYIDIANYPSIKILGTALNVWIENSTKICVGIYAFITGYAYYKNNKQTLKYGIKKSFSLLKKYWFVTFLIFVPIIYFVCHETITWKIAVLNIFALRDPIINIGWYVYFYIFAMLTLPLMKKICNGRWLHDFVIPIGMCVLGYNLLQNVDVHYQFIVEDLRKCFLWMQCILMGYLMAKYDVFEKLDKIFRPKNIVIAILIVIMVMGERLKTKAFYGLGLDVIYVPIMVYALTFILNRIKNRGINKGLEILGNNSLNIWFLHGLFFSKYVNQVFQPIALLFKNPILTIIWVTFLCLVASELINVIFKIANVICNNLKKKLFKSCT